MNYGLYLSATGVLTNSYRQDVIANNLANVETVGFKRDLPLFQQRLTEAQQHRDLSKFSNPLLEGLGGGLVASPTSTDQQQGELEHTGNDYDAAIDGRGYFAVQDRGQTRLTRNGQFMADRQGFLVLSNAQGQRVLDVNQKPIQLISSLPVAISKDGQITQGGKLAGQLGVFNVADATQLHKEGATLFVNPGGLKRSDASIRSGTVERSNADPALELAALMDTQRQLEANANMIRYQDQMLSKLNEVGKIG